MEKEGTTNLLTRNRDGRWTRMDHARLCKISSNNATFNFSFLFSIKFLSISIDAKKSIEPSVSWNFSSTRENKFRSIFRMKYKSSKIMGRVISSASIYLKTREKVFGKLSVSDRRKPIIVGGIAETVSGGVPPTNLGRVAPGIGGNKTSYSARSERKERSFGITQPRYLTRK